MPAYDAIIVGTRCAGASLALLLARKGYRVLGVDRARFPSDTLSTHFLPPRSAHFLDSWGLLERLAATGCPRIDSMTMHYGPVVLRGRPDAVGGTAAMYCPRRTVLDQLLVESARQAGAEMREGTLMRELLWDGERVAGIRAVGADGKLYEERAKLVVGADGAFSLVARLVAAEAEIHQPSLTCGYYAYWRGVPTDGVEFYVRAGRDMLVFPTHDGLTCVWAGRARESWGEYRSDVERGYVATLDPELCARLDAGERTSPFRGTNKLPNFYRRAAGPGWALVGDAAYHRDPLTGMGIGDAFLGASLLAEAVDTAQQGDPTSSFAGYRRALRERTQAVFDYTLRAAALKDPAPQVPLYMAIAASAAATRQFMNVLAGTLPYRDFFNRDNIARLSGGLAAAG
jgi:2-polyprenyl-6-methoxyphenol hydroxylase-like FAD-dependent oxidoreductase